VERTLARTLSGIGLQRASFSAFDMRDSELLDPCDLASLAGGQNEYRCPHHRHPRRHLPQMTVAHLRRFRS
jgi:hypothetical protein